jgi:RNA polymerase sigma factor (sigma-70 family)
MATTMNSVLLEKSGVPEAIISATFRSCPQLLGSLYNSHYRYVLKVCRHFFWQREDAEDAAAEVFLKLHTVLDSEEQPIKSRSWLSKVTGRHCIDKLRQVKAERRRRVDDEIEFDTLPDNLTLSPLSFAPKLPSSACPALLSANDLCRNCVRSRQTTASDQDRNF